MSCKQLIYDVTDISSFLGISLSRHLIPLRFNFNPEWARACEVILRVVFRDFLASPRAWAFSLYIYTYRDILCNSFVTISALTGWFVFSPSSKKMQMDSQDNYLNTVALLDCLLLTLYLYSRFTKRIRKKL